MLGFIEAVRGDGSVVVRAATSSLIYEDVDCLPELLVAGELGQGDIVEFDDVLDRLDSPHFMIFDRLKT